MVATLQDVVPGTSLIYGIQRHFYLFMLPENTTHEDFFKWVMAVSQQKPELKEVLDGLTMMTTEDYRSQKSLTCTT